MRFFKEYLEEKFHHRVYRVPIDLQLGCPRGNDIENRCFFCDEDGARAPHILIGETIEKQIADGLKFIRKNYGENCGLAAYVQAHTGTNANASELEKLYRKILSLAKFDCIIIATRPDCLPNETVSLFKTISNEIELWIELGVQSANDETLRIINRGHTFREVKDAVRRLETSGINSAAHLILGLPNEGHCEFRKTAEKISSLPFKAVKIHNLLILKNTVFEKWHQEKKIKTMNEHQYAAVLVDFVRRLPNEILLMRVCADSDEKKVIAPKWGMSKAQFIEMFRTMISEEKNSKFCEIRTADGSPTLWHPQYREHYRSIAGAQTESKTKFVSACEIRKKLLNKGYIRILEIGFGHGSNLSETIKLLKELQGNFSLEYISVENDFSGLENAITLDFFGTDEIQIFKTLAEKKIYQDKCLEIKIIEGDGRIALSDIDGKFDAVYLDPFSTEKNVEMWTFDFIREIGKKMRPDSILATYSSAYTVRGALLKAGFYLGETSPLGRRRGATVASFSKDQISMPISQKEEDIIRKSRAGLPYRDHGLRNSQKDIKDYRAKLTLRLRKMGIPKWLK